MSIDVSLTARPEKSGRRRVWIVSLLVLAVVVLVPYAGILIGYLGALYTHRRGVASARNMLLAVSTLMLVFAVTMTPITSIGGGS